MVQLSEEQRLQLDGIIQDMSNNGESEADIQFVVDDFKSKYEGKTNAAAEETAPVVAETPVDTDLQLENGSSELQDKQIQIDTLKKRFDSGEFKMAERDAYEKYRATGEIELPEKEAEEPGFVDEVVNFVTNTVPKVYQDAQYMGSTMAYEDAVEAKNALETREAEIREKAARSGWSDNLLEQQLSLFQNKAGKTIGKTKEEAEAYYDSIIDKETKDIAEATVKSSQYQDRMAKVGSATFFDEEGEWDGSMNDFKRVLGAQAPQMIASMATLGLWSGVQEAAGTSMEIARKKAARRLNVSEQSFAALPKEEQADAIIQVVKNGEADIDVAIKAGLTTAGLDMASNFVTFGGAKLIPKSLITKFTKQQMLYGAGKLGLASGFESITEAGQEVQKGARIEAALDNRKSIDFADISDYVSENPTLVKETMVQAALVPGPLQIGSTVIQGGYKEGVKYIAGLDPNSAQTILNETTKGINEQYTANKNAIYEDQSLSQQEKDNAIAELTKNYDEAIEGAEVAKSVVNSTKLKSLSPDRKRKAFEVLSQLPAEQKKLNDLKSKLEEGPVDADLELQIEDQESKVSKIKKEALKQRALDTMDKNGFVLADYINSDKTGEFANKSVTTFDTIEDAKKYFTEEQLKDENVQGLLNGENNAIRLGNEAIIVKETVEKGMDYGSFTGANSVQHEVLHFMFDSMDDAAVDQLINSIKQNVPKDDSAMNVALDYANKREKQYSDDGVSGRKLQEEFLTALSDGLQNYRIADIDLESGRKIRKIAESVKNIFTKNTNNNLDFSDIGVSNVTQFLKNYNKFSTESKLKTKKSKSTEEKTAPSKVDKPTSQSNDLVKDVVFEEGSINEAFSNFSYDGKVNNAPSDFQVTAAYQYEPLAASVIDRVSKIGLGSKGSPEQNNFIIDALADQQTKEDLIADLVYGTDKNKASSLLGLAKTYNPAIGSFGGYAKGFLGARAIRILDERIGKQATQGAQTIDAPESKEIADSSDITDIAKSPIIEQLNIEDKISQDLNKLGELSIIQAEKAVTSKKLSDLKKLNARNKAFGDIFSKRLFNDIKDVLGKNTKAASDFSDFVNNNYETLSDVALNYIDFQKGTGPASEWSLDNPPTKDEFNEYYAAVGEKASTRGDRKKSLNNAIARAIANDTRTKMVENNPSLNEGFEKVSGISLAQKRDIPYDLVLDESLNMAKMLKLQEVDMDGVKISSLANEEDIIKYFNYQEQSVWPLVPKRFVMFTQENTSNQYTSNSGKGLLTDSNKGEVRKALRPFFYKEAKRRINNFNNFGPDILLDGKPIEDYKNKSYSTIQKPLERIAEKKSTVADREIIAAFNKRNTAIGKELYTRFNKAIQDDKQNAIGIAAFLNLATNNTEHFNRALAEVVAISINPKGQIKKDGSPGRKYEWEHAMQQSHVARVLLEGMLDPNRNFEVEFEAIMDNFKLIGLDYSKNDLLKEGGFQLSMTGKLGGKWDILNGTWLSRYFNDIMAELGGIEPSSIMHVSGVTLDKYYNIDVNGNSTSAASKVDLDTDFNKMLERVKGVKAEARYSQDRANKLAGNKGKFKFFVPYSAEDYLGLVYPTLGKGREGDRNLQWYKDNIVNPFAIGIANYEKAKVESLQQWRNLKKQVSKTPAKLNKEATRGFTNEEAVRVYLWNEQDVVPDTLAKKDVEALVKHVEDSKDLTAFAENVKGIVGIEGYPPPNENWISGSLTIDLIDNINTTKRSEFLQEWQDNVDVVYSKDNMNKLKALYGERYTEALENILHRMKTGRNRPSGATRLENQFMNWINDSVGTVMFFNTRSALLQTISSVNFLNWSDNNPLMAGKAFANQPQFWKDFANLFNSDFLKSRRSGLKNDINADELAKSAASSDNKVRAALSSLLKAGFLPTQIADSFAISIGGASFYRNRYNTYKKDGLSDQEAKDKAMLDFQETAEESQQSSRPDRVSMQQASGLGRVVLAFANTPMQYTRLTKKAALDLINGRGDWKTNMSKILYYGAVQNIIFTALQQAMFAMLFDDDEIDDEEQTEASTKIVNGIADTFLRGSGVGGAAVATMKNIIMEIIKQKKSKRPDYTKAALKLTTLSPPVDTKIRKLMSAGRAFTYKQSLKDMNRLGIDIDNPAALATGQVLSAVANLPADRAILKMQNVKGALDTEHQAWQRIAMGLGFADWQLGIKDDKSKDNRAWLEKLKKTDPSLYQTIKEAEKLSKSSPTKRLERGVAGKAHNDGTIEVDPNLTPVEREKTIAHEKKHVEDMKAGKLNYDDNYVYWNGKKYERKNGKIKYNGKWYEEGHKSLPWEKRAYDAEPTTKEIKKRKKLY